ncbi:peptidylprolyl isomerase [Marinobacterium sediminicola]|uniref:Chaperone SurA n=1 Tax=Marinobacterium sediminicola TaxID=518898 RepID=A0ABY1RY40_9GAMM|nr:peptidylprolyl isomerase [Marinobacterium sediminicola]ULG68700.1 peptidylprolyl isomerase [Marinobacterium sediminicola]SMR73224.1 periplasmic chaperone for outer membrane proteins SurA [Marinobacterium sediminicola]
MALSKLRQPLLALALLTAPLASLQAEVLDRVAAVVNEDIVLESELDQRLELVRQQIAARQETRLPPEDVLRQQVMDRLILERIQLQIAESQGIRVSDRQLNEALNRIAAQNNMTLPQFRDALMAEGQDYALAREQIRREILLTQVQQSSVNRRINVSEQEVQNFLDSELGQQQIQAEYQLRNILFALPESATPEMIGQTEAKAMEARRQLEQGTPFAELAIAVSNAPNALQGGELGWRRESELPQALAKAINKLSPGEVSQPVRTPGGFHLLLVENKRGGKVQLVEQTKVRHILLTPNEIRSPEQTRRLIDDLYQRLREGQPFDELARRYSDDAASGSQGGDLGWTQDGQMVPEFEQVMNSTSKGEISEPFESRFGWHILQVQDYRTQDLGEEMLESQARNSIRQRKFSEELSNWLREIRSQAYIERKI